MVETLEKGGNRIDRASQVILRALNGGDEWVRGKTLREAADLSQNGQVFYRMEEHLMPSGLVQEAARTERNGHVEPRQFRLTVEGAAWVDEHAEALAIPTTREETAAKAGEAYEAAESARSSVQNYRKKLHRVKSRVEDLEEVPERVRETETKLQYQAESLGEIRSQSNETVESQDEMQEVVDRQRGEIEALEEENAELADRLGYLEQDLNGLVRLRAKHQRDRRQIRDGLSPFVLIFSAAILFLIVYLWLTFTGQLLPVLVSGFVGGVLWSLALFLARDWLYPRRKIP